MLGEKVVGGIVVELPVGVMAWVINVQLYDVPLFQIPVGTHLLRRAVRRGVGQKKWKEDDAHGDRSKKCVQGAGVERSSSHDKVTRQLEGGEGAAAGGHYKGGRKEVAA